MHVCLCLNEPGGHMNMEHGYNACLISGTNRSSGQSGQRFYSWLYMYKGWENLQMKIEPHCTLKYATNKFVILSLAVSPFFFFNFYFIPNSC